MPNNNTQNMTILIKVLVLIQLMLYCVSAADITDEPPTVAVTPEMKMTNFQKKMLRIIIGCLLFIGFVMTIPILYHILIFMDILIKKPNQQ